MQRGFLGLVIFISVSFIGMKAHAIAILSKINIHMAGFYICYGVACIVFIILIYSLLQYRKSIDATSEHFHKHLISELFWTTLPFLILIGLALPATIAWSRACV